MNTSNHSSINDTINTLVSEYDKLQDSISQMIKDYEKLKMEDIIGLYFQVINVTSFTKSLSENNLMPEKESDDFKKIAEIEKYIDKKFNEYLHPLLMSQLEKTVENFKINLKNVKAKQNSKTKNEIENQAKDFEKLRQLMSTQEFVNQYDKVLKKSK